MANNAQPDPLGPLGDVLKCLVEGPEDPPPMEGPPDGFRVSAEQDKQRGKLNLTVHGLKDAEWEVEVVFDDPDPKDPNDPKNAKNKMALPQGSPAAVEFDLPKSWKKSSGPRFVTVYFRKRAVKPENDDKQAAPKKKPQEEPTTIIRIIPARVPRSAPGEFDEAESLAGTDD